MARAAVEEAGVEGSAKEEIAPSSASVLRGQTAQLVRHELGHCTALVVAQIVG